MRTSKTLIGLSVLSALLTALRCGVGLFWQDGGSPFAFTSLRGQTIQMYGQGLYRLDPYFNGPILQGTDAVTLLVGVPVLLIALALYWRGSLRGGILLTSTLVYFLYNAASYAFGVAYNDLFLVYLASFSISLFTVFLALRCIDLQDLALRINASAPRRGITALLFLSALGLLFAWMPDILSGLLLGQTPNVASYTTEITYVLDLGIIVPALVWAGILILRRAPAGYLAASILLIMLAIMGVVITAQCVAQSLAGITLSPGEFVGKAGSFMLLALIAIGLIARLFHHIAEPVISEAATLKAAQVSSI